MWGLSLLWHEVKNDFAYHHKLEFDWDSTYRATLFEVTHTPDRFSYYQILRRLGAQLHDGHTNVYLPGDLKEKYATNPPLRLKRIGKRVFVQSLLNDTLKAAGLSQGDEILLINRIPVIEYAEKHIRPYVSASITQDELNRTYTNELLSGAREDSLLLTIRNKGGKTEDVFFKRGLIPTKR